MSRSGIAITGRTTALWVVLVSTTVGLSLADSVWAGSVFMKNGYIIQGPIVEHSGDAVILGWENGKVTIFQRFVDSVVYDAGERGRLDAVEKTQVDVQAALERDIESGDLEEIEDLPADLDRFLMANDTFHSTLTELQEVTPDSVDGSSTVDVGSTTTPEVVRVEPPTLAERIFSTDGELSLQPPIGWDVKKDVEGALVFVGPDKEDGLEPSLNVVSLPAGGLSVDEFVRLLKEEQTVRLESFEVVTEQSRQLSGEREGYEVIARGAMDGKGRVLRQVLVPHDDRVWLFSAFSATAEEKGSSFELLGEVLKTLEFSAE